MPRTRNFVYIRVHDNVYGSDPAAIASYTNRVEHHRIGCIAYDINTDRIVISGSMVTPSDRRAPGFRPRRSAEIAQDRLRAKLGKKAGGKGVVLKLDELNTPNFVKALRALRLPFSKWEITPEQVANQVMHTIKSDLKGVVA